MNSLKYLTSFFVLKKMFKPVKTNYKYFDDLLICPVGSPFSVSQYQRSLTVQVIRVRGEGEIEPPCVRLLMRGTREVSQDVNYCCTN